jgi:Bacterial HORMA domain family 1
MSATGTQTRTYTVDDVRKVVDNFAADFSMMAQATGLCTRESVAETVSDLKTLAEQGYLIDVKLILKDASGTQLLAAVYTVFEAAAGWTSGRPGGNLWPRTPGGVLKVVAALSPIWWAMTPDRKASYISRHGLNSPWDLTTEDTSFAGLASSAGQRYASNGYGWERMNYG